VVSNLCFSCFSFSSRFCVLAFLNPSCPEFTLTAFEPLLLVLPAFMCTLGLPFPCFSLVFYRFALFSSSLPRSFAKMETLFPLFTNTIRIWLDSLLSDGFWHSGFTADPSVPVPLFSPPPPPPPPPPESPGSLPCKGGIRFDIGITCTSAAQA